MLSIFKHSWRVTHLIGFFQFRRETYFTIKLGQPSHGRGKCTQPREVWPFYYLFQITVSKQMRHQRSEEPHIVGVKTYAPQYLEINNESSITTGKVLCCHGNRAAMSSEGSNVCVLCSVRCYSEVLKKWIIQETKQGGDKTSSFEAYHFWSLLKCSEYSQGWSYDTLALWRGPDTTGSSSLCVPHNNRHSVLLLIAGIQTSP